MVEESILKVSFPDYSFTNCCYNALLVTATYFRTILKSCAFWIFVLARKMVSPLVSSFSVHVEISSSCSFLNSHKVLVLI